VGRKRKKASDLGDTPLCVGGWVELNPHTGRPRVLPWEQDLLAPPCKITMGKGMVRGPGIGVEGIREILEKKKIDYEYR
jgi:L-alanine-DL-glutamate epimerase-like enolase superfamily enzyme